MFATELPNMNKAKIAVLGGLFNASGDGPGRVADQISNRSLGS